MALTFKCQKDILTIAPPTAKAAIEVWHSTLPGFGVRIGRARASDGKVRRTYIGRIDVLQPDGSAKNDKPIIGLAHDIGTGDRVVTYKEASNEAARILRDAKLLRAGGSIHMTVAKAFEKLGEELSSSISQDSAMYATKIRGTYNRLLSHLGSRYLDELKEGFWLDYVRQLREGKLDVGTDTSTDGGSAPTTRKAGTASYAISVLNIASRLYKKGHEYRGIQDEPRGWDPTRLAVAKIEKPNTRETYLEFRDIPKSWAATDQLMAPCWRDMFRVYLLTGLRDTLVLDMRFSQIDFERGLYLINPLQRGTKRRRRAMSQNDRVKPIEMPLSSYVLDIIRRRKVFAPSGELGDFVWYSTEQPKVRLAAGRAGRLVDPRTAWKRMEASIGYRVSKSDLRRTFASLGAAVDPSGILSLSLLLLHSSRGIAMRLGVPAITVEYIKGQQATMRATAERVTQAVLELVGERPKTALTDCLRDYVPLPPTIELALKTDELFEPIGSDADAET